MSLYLVLTLLAAPAPIPRGQTLSERDAVGTYEVTVNEDSRATMILHPNRIAEYRPPGKYVAAWETRSTGLGTEVLITVYDRQRMEVFDNFKFLLTRRDGLLKARTLNSWLSVRRR